jgi:hypothetical protein
MIYPLSFVTRKLGMKMSSEARRRRFTKFSLYLSSTPRLRDDRLTTIYPAALRSAKYHANKGLSCVTLMPGSICLGDVFPGHMVMVNLRFSAIILVGSSLRKYVPPLRKASSVAHIRAYTLATGQTVARRL